MNACIYNVLPQDNTTPTWILPCKCGLKIWHCNAKFKPNILCVIGYQYDQPPLRAPIL